MSDYQFLNIDRSMVLFNISYIKIIEMSYIQIALHILFTCSMLCTLINTRSPHHSCDQDIQISGM
jgi:hypothetical protein